MARPRSRPAWLHRAPLEEYAARRLLDQAPLFHRYRFRQIARLIHVSPLGDGCKIGKELCGHGIEDRCPAVSGSTAGSVSVFQVPWPAASTPLASDSSSTLLFRAITSPCMFDTVLSKRVSFSQDDHRHIRVNQCDSSLQFAG